MRIYELRQKIAELKAKGKGAADTNPWAVEIHKKFAIPAACFVFGFLGLGFPWGARRGALGRLRAFHCRDLRLLRLHPAGEQAGNTGLIHPFLACGEPTWSWSDRGRAAGPQPTRGRFDPWTSANTARCCRGFAGAASLPERAAALRPVSDERAGGGWW